MIPLVDLFLFDYKVTSREKHKLFTGVEQDVILNNLDLIYDAGKWIILRCPIVPGYNDTEERLRGIHQLEMRMSTLMGIEILTYHNLGSVKAKAIGMKYEVTVPTIDREAKEGLKKKLSYYGCDSSLINSF